MIATPVASVCWSFLNTMMFRDFVAGLAKDAVWVELVLNPFKAGVIIRKLFVETRDIVSLFLFHLALPFRYLRSGSIIIQILLVVKG